MVVTQAKLNACSDIEGYAGTMLACAMADFVGMDLADNAKAFANKCWQVARGDKITARSLMKMVRTHLS